MHLKIHSIQLHIDDLNIHSIQLHIDDLDIHSIQLHIDDLNIHSIQLHIDDLNIHSIQLHIDALNIHSIQLHIDDLNIHSIQLHIDDLNIHSIQLHIDDLRTLLVALDYMFDIIAISTQLKIVGKIIDDDKEIATNFNKFFVNVGPSTGNMIPKVPDLLPKFLRNHNQIKFVLPMCLMRRCLIL